MQHFHPFNKLSRKYFIQAEDKELSGSGENKTAFDLRDISNIKISYR